MGRVACFGGRAGCCSPVRGARRRCGFSGEVGALLVGGRAPAVGVSTRARIRRPKAAHLAKRSSFHHRDDPQWDHYPLADNPSGPVLLWDRSRASLLRPRPRTVATATPIARYPRIEGGPCSAKAVPGPTVAAASQGQLSPIEPAAVQPPEEGPGQNSRASANHPACAVSLHFGNHGARLAHARLTRGRAHVTRRDGPRFGADHLAMKTGTCRRRS